MGALRLRGPTWVRRGNLGGVNLGVVEGSTLEGSTWVWATRQLNLGEGQGPRQERGSTWVRAVDAIWVQKIDAMAHRKFDGVVVGNTRVVR